MIGTNPKLAKSTNTLITPIYKKRKEQKRKKSKEKRKKLPSLIFRNKKMERTNHGNEM